MNQLTITQISLFRLFLTDNTIVFEGLLSNSDAVGGLLEGQYHVKIKPNAK